jgi:hypothetical protein
MPLKGLLSSGSQPFFSKKQTLLDLFRSPSPMPDLLFTRRASVHSPEEAEGSPRIPSRHP